jgi:tape measure domain-containing protein
VSFRALGQMMSKGKIQAEELRGQLGDRLPGAFVRFAVALKMTKPGELDQALKKGAISGEKMKNAIIDVANALQVEFAGSADKMSKTVDAAFNRLKNAFTFAAGDLGHSGLNQALINIMDTATKLLQSNTLNTLLSGLGATFKFLGDHIEIVAGIIGTLALSSTLKWAASLVGLGVSATTATVAVEEATAAAAAESATVTEAAVATTFWGSAWTKLNLIMRANIFLIISGAIVAVMMALNKTTDAMQENAKALDAVNARMPDAANFSDAYSAKLLNLADSANQVTVSLQQMIQQMNEAALRASQEDLKGLTTYKRVGVVGDYGINVRSSSGKYVQGPEGYFTKQDQDLLNRVTYKTSTGVALRGNIPQTKQEFEQLGAAMSMVDTRATGPGGGNFSPVQSALHARFNALISQSRQKGYTGLPYSDWAEQILPGYNNPVGGIEGGSPAAKAKKASHKKSDAEMAADDVASAIDSAMKALGDLEVKAKATADTVDGLLGGSFDKFTAAAHVAAQEQEKNFEDQIRGHGKVSELQAQQQAVMGLAQKLQGQGKIDAGVDISSYDSAKRAIIGVYEALDALDAARKRDSEVANNVAEMRDSNNIQEQAIKLLGDRKNSQADVNKYVEVENQLLGTSIEKRPALRKALEDEIDRREQLKRSLEATNEQRDFENKKLLDSKLTPLYQSGVKQEDIDYYKELISLEQQLRDAGASDVEIQQRINLRSAILNQGRAMQFLQDQYEKTKETAADLADAIVGGFRDGIEAGDNFLKIFKSIFSQLEKIILDFVLYNPLKQWLTQQFTQALSPNSTAGFGGVGSPGSGTVNSYATGGGAVSQNVSSIMGFLLGGQSSSFHEMPQYVNQNVNVPGAGGSRFSIDQNGDIVSGPASSGPITVVGTPQAALASRYSASIPPPVPPQNFWDNIKKLMTSSAKDQAAIKTFMQTGKGFGAAAGAAVGTLAEAYEIYKLGNKLGSGIAKALGGGFRTQAVVGGSRRRGGSWI